ncbi:tetratricopeptide repeat-containing sensor histidine kinase [uncultured Tenacibaculum sp.]|uniref:tetratricopeptide repeat-containing sensor histidine kinase n=1 Tax=uncultured Tenacibaculum sp. TaxID=174713 RepID=UPI0026131308|nr:tetratricopeptide repeat-containing sensor histidine kinase [uncultured Tenacibaculum sp.]
MYSRLFFFLFFSLYTFFSFSQNSKDVIIKKGLDAYYAKDTIELKKNTYELLKIFNKDKDSSALAKYYHYKALIHKIQFTGDSTYYYYHQSKNISEKLNDSSAVGGRLLSIAVLQRNTKDFLGSQITSIQALKFLEPINSQKLLATTYNNLGIVSEELDQIDSSLKYYKKSLEINNLNNNPIEYLYVLNNLGFLYQKRGKHNKAITYFQKGLNVDSIIQKFPNHYALLLENLAFSNYSIGKKENVLQQYNQVLKIRKGLNNFSDIPLTLINISNYYKDNNDTKKALFHAQEALKYAKQTSNNKKWLEALDNLSELTNGSQSKQYLKDYIALNDSLFQKERIQKNQFAKIRYETEKKEKENVQLKIDNEYQKQQTIIGWLVAASILLLFGFSVSFFTFRRKRLLFEAQLQKASAREQERKQIAKSLHDEVAGDLRMLHQKLEKSQLFEEASKLNDVKENVRNLSHQLSSVSFKKVPFKDQIINLVSDYFSLDFRIKVNGLQEHDWTQVNSAIKRLLYLSIRESIQNCKKYAEANLITIDFSIHKKYVFLSIADNGTGFDTTKSKKGIGLRNLQERVEELSGTLNIESEVGKGTQIHIQIPLNA